MATDYHAICKEHEGRFGWDENVREYFARQYSERQHFLFEILQNAEDAGAKEVMFDLHKDCLIVHHNGRLFNEKDVRGICGILMSTKDEDLTQIGKFGIGFKSVYAYTRTPEVHSGAEDFRIEKYVCPVAVEPVDLDENETCFIFPFDHPKVTALRAVEEIAAALSNLDPRTLLFLRNIELIRFRREGENQGTLERELHWRSQTSRRIVLNSSLGGEEVSDVWFVWHRSLGELEQPERRVEIAFRVVERNGVDHLGEIAESPLVVIFPTKMATHLGFLIQGPFLTTPSRETIQEDDDWNESLVDQMAKLLSTVLLELSSDHLLTVEVLEALPLEPSSFKKDGLLRPLFEVVRQSISTEKLVPIEGGGYGAAKSLKLARGTGLRDLLSREQLQQLFGETDPLAFVTESITSDRHPRLHRYLREEIGVDEVTPENFLRRVTLDFLTEQDDGWIAHFYHFLHGNAALWRGPLGVARKKPILRLEDCTHVDPFDKSGKPNAYLPGQSQTEFPTIRRAVATDDKAREFLGELGLTEPDVVAEVLENVLPRYARVDVPLFDDVQNRTDLELISRALGEATFKQREYLRAQLKRATFVVGRNAGTGERRFCTPSSLYEFTPELDTYFEGNPEAWFLEMGDAAVVQDLRTLGLRTAPQVQARTPDARGYVDINHDPGDNKRGLQGFDPDAKIDGLEYALRHPTVARSEYVWNQLLLPNRRILVGNVESATHKSFDNSHKSRHQSPAGKFAMDLAWLPALDGTFQVPSELLLDDLPADFQRDEALAKALGMKSTVVEEASRQLGFKSGLLQGLRDHPDILARAEQEIATRSNSGDDEFDDDQGGRAGSDASADVEYRNKLRECMNRQGTTQRGSRIQVDSAHDPVRDPEQRIDVVSRDIESDRGEEPPPEERFRRVPRRVWERRDYAVKHFLLEEYHGQCQICSETFMKRDGSPYFEGVFLVSRNYARYLDRPGNVLCLCASCSAKFQFGPVESDTFVDQVESWQARRRDGEVSSISIRLCDVDVEVQYSERHLIELQALVENRRSST